MRSPCAHLLVVLVLAACGGRDPTSSDDQPDAKEPWDGTPRVRVLVNDRPHDPASEERETSADTPERYGDPLHVIVDGIEPGTRVRVETHSPSSGDSSALFEADTDGTVDLARDAPLSGDWSGVDADAFIWSMLPAANPPAITDLTLVVDLVRDGKAGAGDDGDVLATATVTRRYINDGLATTTVDDGTLQGVLALPDTARFGDGPYPGVLVFGGSEGGTGTGIFDAMYLASLGYAALGVGYFGAPNLPASLTDVPLELLEDDLAFLAADPHVDAEHLGVMGGSRGGELALLLGAHFPVVSAVVANVPSGYVWGAGNGVGDAWTLDGEPLASVPAAPGVLPDWESDADGVTHYSFRNTFLEAIAVATPEALAAATIHSEDIRGSVLLVGGDDDQLWASCELMAVAAERRAAAPGPHDATLCCEDAGHSIFIPGGSTFFTREYYRDDQQVYWVLGGTPAGNGRAGRLADTATRKFLEDAL